MESKYSRNRIYISNKEQEKIKNCSILLGGCGIGSVIAECALRLGFEKITLVDGDCVEESNLNRQNYNFSDIGEYKVIALSKRLKSINPNASISTINSYITEDNIDEIISGHDVAINALDFTSEIPLSFDKICQQQGIPVLHPYNIGWGGLLTIIGTDGPSLHMLKKPGVKFNEVDMVKYATSYLSFWGNPQQWIDDILNRYLQEEKALSPPQLSIASWIVGAMCTNVLYSIATDKPYKKFPEFYLSTIKES